MYIRNQVRFIHQAPIFPFPRSMSQACGVKPTDYKNKILPRHIYPDASPLSFLVLLTPTSQRAPLHSTSCIGFSRSLLYLLPRHGPPLSNLRMGSLADSLLVLCSPTMTPSPPYVAGRLAVLASTTPPVAVNVQPALIALTDRYVFWRGSLVVVD